MPQGASRGAATQRGSLVTASGATGNRGGVAVVYMAEKCRKWEMARAHRLRGF